MPVLKVTTLKMPILDRYPTLYCTTNGLRGHCPFSVSKEFASAKITRMVPCNMVAHRVYTNHNEGFCPVGQQALTKNFNLTSKHGEYHHDHIKNQAIGK